MTHLDTIKQLRSEGKSWRQIGRVQGTTGQAAWDYHNRYTKPRKIKVFYENFAEAYYPTKVRVRKVGSVRPMSKAVKRDVMNVPSHMRGDEQTRNDNLDAGNRLCERCDGTGNELFSMYRKCPRCNGTGVEPKKPNDNN